MDHLVVQVVAAQVAEDGEDDVCRQGKAREVVLGVACTDMACRLSVATAGTAISVAHICRRHCT